jgi:putative transcriptional regulator
MNVKKDSKKATMTRHHAAQDEARAAASLKRKLKPKSRAMGAVLEAAGDLEQAGLIGKKTMRDFEELCAAPPKYTARDVARIRQRVHASQGFFARSLNVSPSAVQQWEAGVKKPSGPAARLLAVVEKHGLDVLA